MAQSVLWWYMFTIQEITKFTSYPFHSGSLFKYTGLFVLSTFQALQADIHGILKSMASILTYCLRKRE